MLPILGTRKLSDRKVKALAKATQLDIGGVEIQNCTVKGTDDTLGQVLVCLLSLPSQVSPWEEWSII